MRVFHVCLVDIEITFLLNLGREAVFKAFIFMKVSLNSFNRIELKKFKLSNHMILLNVKIKLGLLTKLNIQIALLIGYGFWVLKSFFIKSLKLLVDKDSQV